MTVHESGQNVNHSRAVHYDLADGVDSKIALACSRIMPRSHSPNDLNSCLLPLFAALIFLANALGWRSRR